MGRRPQLVCRHLRDAGPIAHVREDGRLEPHAAAEGRLLARCGLPPTDLFRTRAELVEEAYDRRGERIAFVARPDPGPDEDAA